MSKSFSLKNILLGVLLGLTIIGSWMFCVTFQGNLSLLTRGETEEKVGTGNRTERGKRDRGHVFAAERKKEEALATPATTEKIDVGIAHRQTSTPVSRKDAEKGRKAADSAQEAQATLENAGSARLRGLVEPVEQLPPTGERTYPFVAFDNAKIAESFVASIKGSTNMDLKIVQQGDLYVVCIQAASEGEKNGTENLIYQQSGVKKWNYVQKIAK